MDDEPECQVVRNLEEQYSIWPSGQQPPDGWTAVGVTGARSECLDFIGRTWTDMRPRSVRAARE